jgi:hypothetical protein
MHRVRLFFPNKLALPGAGVMSRLSLLLVHGLLFAGLFIPFYGPLMAVLSASIILAAEASRRNPFARDAVAFGAQRCALFTVYALLMIGIVPALPTTKSPFWYWHFSCFIMGVIAIHDIVSVYRGRVGLFYVRAQKQERLR